MSGQLLERRRKKRNLRVALGGVLMVAATVVVLGTSQLMASLTSSAETADVFTEAAELPPDLIDSVVWGPDPVDLPRSMEPLTRLDVTASWLRAWEQLRIVAETGDTSAVEVYFSSSAREAILSRANSWDGRPVRQLGHKLALTFYSEDGQVIGLRSTDTRLERSIEVGDQTLVVESKESYEAVLVLEDGNWRVHHWVRRSFAEGGVVGR